MSLCGTRGAAVTFQQEVGKLMRSLGYRPSKFNPSLFYHPRDGIKVLVHGDDFVASGERSKIIAFKEQLWKRFTIKSKVVGSGSQHVTHPDAALSGDKGGWQEGEFCDEKQEARILNRIVRWAPQGWEYEADQRHAELIIQAMGMEKGKAVSTPGDEEPTWKLEDNEKDLGPKETTLYRMVAARANYLAADRADIQYAVKECCRGMAAPQVHHLSGLKRLARYLVGRPRMVWAYPWQQEENVTTFSDSNWAGCKRTARSTSCGIVMRESITSKVGSSHKSM